MIVVYNKPEQGEEVMFKNILSGKKGPVVVAAMQSPHLLNIWHDTKVWRLYYDLLGDHDGLEETKEKEIRSFSSSKLQTNDVAAVLVTTPKQLETAGHKYPKAKIFWVVHTGYFLEVLPTDLVPKIAGIVTLTRTVRDIQIKHKPALVDKKNFVITPFYESNPIWSWKPGVLWTIRSRATQRMAASKDRFEAVMTGLKEGLSGEEKLFFYGSEAPDGYIDKAGKRALSAGSSGYISALPEDAGFGLAEHEAMAFGVPIVGSRWGDMKDEAPEAYEALCAEEADMISYGLRLARDQDFAESMSRAGLEYIKQYRTKAAMEKQIGAFVASLR